MSTLKVSTISPLGTDSTKTITIGSGANGDKAEGVFTNKPYFSVYLSSSQTVSDDTATKVQFDTEFVDTDSTYDNTTNYRFTVPTGQAGKYFFNCDLTAAADTTQLNDLKLFIYKNGSNLTGTEARVRYQSQNISRASINTTAILNLSVGDYIEIYGQLDISGGSSRIMDSGKCRFTGYRMIGA